MSEADMLVIKVPGSSANLGPGFDSLGLALNIYLTLEVEQSDRWEVIPLSKELEMFPSDETNFICKTAINIAALYEYDHPPCRIHMKSEIPLARGLGSSAAAIVTAIELANAVCDLQLTDHEKLELAAQLEGHPDNVGASLYGGLVIGCQQEKEVELVTVSDLDLDLVAVIPKEELLTKTARGVLPSELPYSEAVEAGAISNVLVAALLTKNWGLAGKMMGNDMYHQPYRKKLMPHIDPIEREAYEHGAFGVAISGAGPTILCYCEPGKGKALSNHLRKALPNMDVKQLEVDVNGSVVKQQVVRN